jgi:23S rRNA pseudouridine1911/1915/1917 synthase
VTGREPPEPEPPEREFRGDPGRLDRVLSARLELPRAEVQRAIADGRVLVDGAPRPKSHRLSGGERIAVRDASEQLLAEGEPVAVRFEDAYLLVVSKPPGVITHPTSAHRGGTLVNRLLAMGRPLAPAGGPLRPGIVHRLDAGTSGLLVVAKDDETYEALRAMMRRHEAERRYVALVRGSLEHDRFVVDAPLGRSGPRIRVQAGSGREAETRFEVLERFSRATLAGAAPRTGRTHQIRVHLAAIGHPILGDGAYGGGGDQARALGLSRPFLHAERLRFRHPRTGANVDVRDELPEDLRSALRRIRRET